LVHGTPFSLVRVGDAARARHALKGEPAIAAVELNHIRYALATPNDPRFSTEQQYLLPLRIPAAWDVSRGSTAVKVAIVDTGVDLAIPTSRRACSPSTTSSTPLRLRRATRGAGEGSPAS